MSAVITLFTLGFGFSYVTETTTETDAPSIYYGRRSSVRVVPGVQTGSTSATTAIAPTTAQDTTDTSVPTTQPTTQSTTRPTTTTIITTTTTTVTPTAYTVAPSEVIDDEPLVCTMGIRTNSTQMFPPDGLCEYLFYDSLYLQGRNTFAAPNQFDINLRTFVDIAPSYSTTSFGIGFSYNSALHLQLYLQQQATKKFNVMQHFWDHSIYHIGVLDSATVDPKEADVISALNCLKILRDDFSQEIISQGIKVFTFFAASIPDATWASFYTRNFTNLLMPDLYIALGHYSRGDNSLPTCLVVPPTLLHRPRAAEDSYQYDLTSAAESIVRLSGLRLKSALSVTLSGHLAVLKDPTKRGFLAPCMTNNSIDSFASYAEVCRSPNYTSPPVYDPQAEAVQYSYTTEPMVFSYDDRKGLVRKLCAIKEQHTNTKFGIAVFDVDYADFTNVCKSRGGPFARLQLVRSVLNFFRTRYKTTADKTACVQLAYKATAR
ncbi:hypothetical protein MTO96_008782 [Rhipicephalus appendiculatus]